jgi:hypothetical protein
VEQGVNLEASYLTQRTTAATKPGAILVKISLSPSQYSNLRASFQVSRRRIRVHEYMHTIVQVRCSRVSHLAMQKMDGSTDG